MAATAARILDRGLAAAPGGRVVYSTCTISRRENEEVAGAARAAIADLGADPERAPLAAPGDGRFLQTRYDRDRTDGFFIAALDG
jgi:16S rRNA C967 or C1407 C5-methylase (RsmB/RsmF family)